MKRIIKDYCTFTRKERIAVFVLLLLISAFIAAPYLYEPKKETPVINEELAVFLSEIDSETPANPKITSASPLLSAGKRTAEVFPFDPNTIGENDWLRLGLSAKLSRTVMNYRSKGGKFRSAEDIRKIWGLSKTDADRLIPYIRIAGQEPIREKIQQVAATPKTIQPIDINTATADEWKALPGIGDVLSARIVKFRERSAGFSSLDQVRKTYGINDSLFGAISQYLRFSPSTMPKLNLNTASVYELRTKTGMPYRMAKAIVDFRVQNGAYANIDDIRKSVEIPDSLFQKMILLIKTE